MDRAALNAVCFGPLVAIIQITVIGVMGGTGAGSVATSLAFMCGSVGYLAGCRFGGRNARQ